MNPRLLRPTASGFTPRSISGLALWLDASSTDSLFTTDAGPVVAVASPLDIAGCALWLDGADATSMFDATSGGSQVAAGGAVARWQDKSGNGKHCTQATSGNRPVLTSSALNGRSAVTFDGNGDLMQFSGTSRTDETIFAVVQQTADQAGQKTFLNDNGSFYGLSATKSSGRWLEAAFGGFTEGTNRLRVQYSATATDPLGPSVFSVVRSAAAGGAVFIAGTRRPSTQVGNPETFTTSSAVTLQNVGGYAAASGFDFQGHIAEIIVYPTALTTAQRASVESYLAAKWGISGVHAPATASSDPVGYWGDKSGNGRHAVQATAALRPTLGTLGAKNALSFAGNAIATQPYAARATSTYVYVGRHDDTADTFFQTGPTNGFHSHLVEATSKFRRSEASAKGVVLGTNVGVGVDSLWCVDFSNDAISVRHNGVTYGTTSTASETTISDSSRATTLGRLAAAETYAQLNGRIAEFMVYGGRNLTASERGRLERFLAAKYGITLAPTVANADAQNWIDRVYANGGTVSSATAAAVNQFCDAIDAASLRSKMLRLNLFCGTGLNACLTPLYRAASLGDTQLGNATDTNQGPFAAGAYTEATGLTPVFASGHYLDTGLTPDAMPLSVVQAMHLAFSNGPIPAQGSAVYPHLIGAANNPADRHYLGSFEMPTSGSATLVGQLGKQATTSADVLVGANPSSSWVLSRTNATSLAIYQNGSLANTNTSSTTGIASYSRSFWVFRTNFNGSPIGDSIAIPGRHYSIGAGLTGPEVSSYNSALSSFFSAIGRTA